MVLRKLERKTKFLKPLSKDRKLKSNSIITIDLETRKDRYGKLRVYLMCVYDGETAKSYFVKDYQDSIDDMITHAMSDLIKSKYNNRIVYLHNFSNFDGIFLLKYFHRIKNSEINVLDHQGKLIEVSVKIGRFTLKFRDSYLILPQSLNKLAKTFNVESKGTFPIFFADTNSIGYIGAVPHFQILYGYY